MPVNPSDVFLAICPPTYMTSSYVQNIGCCDPRDGDDEPYTPDPDAVADLVMHDGMVVRTMTWSDYKGLFCERCPDSECTYERSSTSCGFCSRIIR